MASKHSKRTKWLLSSRLIRPGFSVMQQKKVPLEMGFLDTPPPLAFAHRGGANAGSENTLESFYEAIRLGYSYIETDVRGTADGKLVVFHDSNTFRMSGVRGKVSRMNFSELVELVRTGHDRTTVPLLEDVLNRFPNTNFNIDVKDRIAAENIADIINRTHSHDRVCITSFSTTRMTTVRSMLDTEVCTGAGILECVYFYILGRRPPGGAAVLQLPMKLGILQIITYGFLARAHRAGLVVHAWTLNDLASIRRALELRVDGIMTDNLVLLKGELEARGLWRKDV